MFDRSSCFGTGGCSGSVSLSLHRGHGYPSFWPLRSYPMWPRRSHEQEVVDGSQALHRYFSFVQHASSCSALVSTALHHASSFLLAFPFLFPFFFFTKFSLEKSWSDIKRCFSRRRALSRARRSRHLSFSAKGNRSSMTNYL